MHPERAQIKGERRRPDSLPEKPSFPMKRESYFSSLTQIFR